MKVWPADPLGGGAPGWLLDEWTPGAHLPPHQHPCGALYLLLEGELCYEEEETDGGRLARCLRPGEMRWVRRR